MDDFDEWSFGVEHLNVMLSVCWRDWNVERKYDDGIGRWRHTSICDWSNCGLQFECLYSPTHLYCDIPNDLLCKRKCDFRGRSWRESPVLRPIVRAKGSLMPSKITGQDSVAAAFADLPKKVQNAITRKGMTEAGRIIRDKARELCPVDTGALRASIKARKPAGSKRGEIRREVAATAPHAHVVELGHKSAHNDVKPHPFMRPALLATENAVRDAIAQSVTESVIEISRKQGT